MKNLSFAQFFNNWKNPTYQWPDLPKHWKSKGRLAWDSYNKGTYVRAIHGELK